MKNKHSYKQNEFKVHTACISLFSGNIYRKKLTHNTNSYPNNFCQKWYNPVRIDKFSQRNISFTKQSAVSTNTVWQNKTKA